MDVLVAIVDLHAVQWGKRAAAATAAAASAIATGAAPQPPVLTLTSFVDQLLVFFNAFLVSRSNANCCCSEAPFAVCTGDAVCSIVCFGVVSQFSRAARLALLICLSDS